MALRSIWNGTIAFAGVFGPIKVHAATEDQAVHFHEVHVDDGAPIEHRRFCSKGGQGGSVQAGAPPDLMAVLNEALAAATK